MYIHLKLKRSFCYLFFFCRFSCAWFERCSSKKVGEKDFVVVGLFSLSAVVAPFHRYTRGVVWACVCVCVCIIFCYCASVFFLLVFFSYRKEKLKSAFYKQTKSLENLSKNNRCLAFRCHFLLFSFVSIFLLCCSASAAVATRSFVSHSVVVAVTVAFCCLCMRVRQHFFKCVCVCALKFIVEYVLIFCFSFSLILCLSVCTYVLAATTTTKYQKEKQKQSYMHTYVYTYIHVCCMCASQCVWVCKQQKPSIVVFCFKWNMFLATTKTTAKRQLQRHQQNIQQFKKQQ